MENKTEIMAYGAVLLMPDIIDFAVRYNADDAEWRWDNLPGFVVIEHIAAVVSAWMYLTPEGRDEAVRMMQAVGLHPHRMQPKRIPMELVELKLQHDAEQEGTE